MVSQALAAVWRGKTALVTGASSGIGEAVARRLAREGLRVILVARREDRLEALAGEIRAAGGQAQVIAADLSVEAERERAAELALAAQGGVQVLVNSAGQAWYGYFAQMPWESARALVEVDVLAAAHLTRLLLPAMIAQGQGRIIQIGSITGSFPNQGIVMYAGSKAFLDASTTALARELRFTAVRVSVLRPGPVASELFEASAAAPGSRMIPGRAFAVPPEAVAAAAWKVILRPRRAVYIPWYMAAAPWIELLFGWFIDQLGPLLLRRNETKP